LLENVCCVIFLSISHISKVRQQNKRQQEQA